MSGCAASLAWGEDLAAVWTPGAGGGTIVGAGPEDVARMEAALPADESRAPDDLELAGLDLDLAPGGRTVGSCYRAELEQGTHL